MYSSAACPSPALLTQCLPCSSHTSILLIPQAYLALSHFWSFALSVPTSRNFLPSALHFPSFWSFRPNSDAESPYPIEGSSLSDSPNNGSPPTSPGLTPFTALTTTFEFASLVLGLPSWNVSTLG
jgi:hypothetical protein